MRVCMCVCVFWQKGKGVKIAKVLKVIRTVPFFSWVECSLMVRETEVHSQVKSYQRLKKWYLISPCLTLNKRYVSSVKWSNPREGVAPFPTPRCSSY